MTTRALEEEVEDGVRAVVRVHFDGGHEARVAVDKTVDDHLPSDQAYRVRVESALRGDEEVGHSGLTVLTIVMPQGVRARNLVLLAHDASTAK